MSRRFDWIELSDDVGNRDIRSGEFLHVSILAAQKSDGKIVPFFSQSSLADFGDGKKWIVVDLRTFNNRNLFIEELDKRPQDPALRLATKSQQNKIVLGKEGIDN